MECAFRDAYLANVWGDPESVSGPGSGVARTAVFREEIPRLLRDLRATSLLDAGCGDFNWMRLVALPVERYLGVDVVPELVEQNSRRHADAKHAFMLADFTRAALPRMDVILSRDCLVHFAFGDVRAALRNFARSGARWLLTTTFVGERENADIETGGWRPLNLQRPPFNFPAPDRVIDEQCLHSGGIYVDKRLGLWRLEELADPLAIVRRGANGPRARHSLFPM
jgi:SAM-dependent methyltransferase